MMERKVFLTNEDKLFIKRQVKKFESYIDIKKERFEIRGTTRDEEFFTVNFEKSQKNGLDMVVISVPLEKVELLWEYFVDSYDCTLSQYIMDKSKFWVTKSYEYKVKEYVFREKKVK